MGDRSGMQAYATSELRFLKRIKEKTVEKYNDGSYLTCREIVKVLQQRWKWDDGTCAGWRDVPMVEGD